MFRISNKYDLFKYNEQYFRPSKLPAINVTFFDYTFFDRYSNDDYNKIKLPDSLFYTPETTILNFFSILREAESISDVGCGSIGNARSPYPISYMFFTPKFRQDISYKTYLHSFMNIGHINLIKLYKQTNASVADKNYKYFIELETIEKSTNGNAAFSYYYGYIYLQNENERYKISNIELTAEDFLCAAYHGWAHNAEFYVDVVYGDWCNLIKKRYPTEQVGYIKNIYIAGNDGREYLFQFIQLTNGTDIEIGQYVKNYINHWEIIKIDVHSCLRTNKKGRK
ncbi:hypothetical protein [Clostridium oryzae]|uniref:Uncharacterized protein n=1 Tax=Clostridium oryzae TaxID=1450648 RepID=A0A1V4IH20_9CLOT|nr:hypothetical protein [Clostridium oryzae]OPJ59292.1 hypothetical protein CLORY_33780 [Clostridium oryzae]